MSAAGPPSATVDVAIDRGLGVGFDRAALRRCVRRMVAAAAATEGQALEAAFRYTDDAVIHALNRDYRAKDKPTDVLAFAQREGPAGATDLGVLGLDASEQAFLDKTLIDLDGTENKSRLGANARRIPSLISASIRSVCPVRYRYPISASNPVALR